MGMLHQVMQSSVASATLQQLHNCVPDPIQSQNIHLAIKSTYSAKSLTSSEGTQYWIWIILKDRDFVGH